MSPPPTKAVVTLVERVGAKWTISVWDGEWNPRTLYHPLFEAIGDSREEVNAKAAAACLNNNWLIVEHEV